MWPLLLMIEIIYILMMLHITLFLPCCQYHNLTKWWNFTFLVAMLLWKYLRNTFEYKYKQRMEQGTVYNY